LTDHKRNKKGTRQLFAVGLTSTPANTSGESQLALENERKMRAVIASKGRVFISYRGSSLCRNISPHSIEGGKKGLLVRAMDHTKNGERSFYVAKITRIEDSLWEVSQGMQLCNVSIYSLVTVEAPTAVPLVASLPATPGQWLQEFCMEKYTAAFEQSGYDTLHVVSVMDESDLDSLGITIPAHRKLFMFKVKELCVRLHR
jgi:hypothetical protein